MTLDRITTKLRGLRMPLKNTRSLSLVIKKGLAPLLLDCLKNSMASMPSQDRKGENTDGF